MQRNPIYYQDTHPQEEDGYDESKAQVNKLHSSEISMDNVSSANSSRLGSSSAQELLAEQKGGAQPLRAMEEDEDADDDAARGSSRANLKEDFEIQQFKLATINRRS